MIYTYLVSNILTHIVSESKLLGSDQQVVTLYIQTSIIKDHFSKLVLS